MRHIMTHPRDKASLVFSNSFLTNGTCWSSWPCLVSFTPRLGFTFTFGKKCLIKFTLPHQMGRKTNRPKDKYYFFEIRYSRTSLTTTLIWRRHCKLTLNFIASYQLNCRSPLRLTHYLTYFSRKLSGILKEFEARLFQLPRMFQNGSKASINFLFLMEQSAPIDTFWGSPFLVWPSLANF